MAIRESVVKAFRVAALGAAVSCGAAAASLVVTSSADSGPGSLRQAVADASAGDVIEFAPGVERIELAGGEIVVDKDIEIRGPNAASPEEQLVVDANGLSRLFRVAGPVAGLMPSVVLSDLAMTGGLAQGGNGGAILNEGNLTLLRCSVYGNAASPGPGGGGNGGGIANAGTLRVEASTLYGNQAFAGGEGTGNGGGLYNGWGGKDAVVPEALLFSSTVSGNQAGVPAGRGAVGKAASHLLALEEKLGMGGGVFNDTLGAGEAWGVDAFPGWVTVEHSTVTANTAWTGGGVANYRFSESGEDVIGEAAGGAMLLRGTIVSGNLASAPGGVTDLMGDALPFDSVLGTHVGNLGGSGNILSLDPGLKPLADNGGATLTHALYPWSPAVNAGPEACGHPADQTGADRVVAGRADSGALENPTPEMPLGRGTAATYQDRDGDAVRISLSGPGEGYATVADGADGVDVVLEGTTRATELQIETAGQTSIRRVLVEGDLASLKAPNVDLLGSITVTGGLKKLVLRDVAGVSRIALGAAPGKGASLQFRHVKDLALTTTGTIHSLSAESWEGQGDGGHDFVQAARLGKVQIRGWARKLRLESDGDVDKVEAGGFQQSYVLAGAAPGLVGLADPRTDLSGNAKIREFTVTGAVSDADGFQFIDGILSAPAIGKASLGVVSNREQSPVCGLSSGSIQRLRYRLGGQEVTLKNLDTFDESVRSGSFTASLDSTADLGFTFGVLDDTRSDLPLPGIAINHLGLMFQHASEDHCRFLLMPGDFATGHMVMCSNETVCNAFDPDGSKSKALSDLQYTELLVLAAQYGYVPGLNLFPTRGNHECYLQGDNTRDQWTKYVGHLLPQNGPTMGTGPDQNPEMDERGFTYSFRFGNSLFLGIDEYAAIHDKDNGFMPDPASTVVPSVFCNGWLAEQVAAYQADSSLQHCFAFGHSPLYRVEMNTSMDATAATATGRDAFVQGVSGSVEIYFCGHEHFYDHTIIAGTTLPGGTGIDAMHQVLVGTGGAEIDAKTQADCHYSGSYIRDASRQYYHNPEVPASGKPQGYIGYNLVAVNGPEVTFSWKGWHVNNPCSILPCGLCSTCTVDSTPVVENSWSYSVQKP